MAFERAYISKAGNQLRMHTAAVSAMTSTLTYN